MCLYWLVVQLALQLLVIAHLADSLHEIFLHNIFTFSTAKKKTVKLQGKIKVYSTYRMANKPASVQTFRKSAPLKLSESLTMAS